MRDLVTHRSPLANVHRWFDVLLTVHIPPGGGVWAGSSCPSWSWHRIAAPCLGDKVQVDWFNQVGPISDVKGDMIAVSGIWTIAAARVAPLEDGAEPIYRCVHVRTAD